MESVVRDQLENFYRGKKIFVTGCTGFKGSWLCLLLKQLGAEVTGYALKPQNGQNSLFSLLSIDKQIQYFANDIKDYTALQQALKSNNFDIVLHLAAQALVRASYEDPLDTYHVNVLGTVNLLEAVRSGDTIRAVVNVTTDKCYANQESVWPYRESDVLGGYDPYSASKACSELVTASYRQAFYNERKIGLATARAGNVIGGGDFSTDRIIPDIYNAIRNKTQMQLRNPQAVRPWQHVLDVLNGYLILAKNLFNNPEEYSQAYNFAPIERRHITVNELVESFISRLKIDNFRITTSANSLYETAKLSLDPSKALLTLGWRPRFDANLAITNTALWYKELLNNSDMKVVTNQQIVEFMNVN